MVFLDYELGESTRIEENRLKKSAYMQRRTNAYGGAAGYFFSYSTLVFSFSYFYRKFNQYSALKRILGSGILALGLFEEASLISVANAGNITEYNYLSTNTDETIRKFYIEQNIQNAKATLRQEANTEKAIRELGHV
jgi:hypothetical protein